MDKLDKLTILSVTALTLYGALLLLTAPDTPRVLPNDKRKAEAQQYIGNPELDNNIQLTRNLIAQDNLDKAESLLDTLIGRFPYKGDLFILKGDILMRRQQPIAAMYEYREAIQINPDFLDKKSKRFQGKKIRITVDEAMALIATNLQLHPKDKQLRSDRETVYYMKRKLAGSCG